MEEMVNLEEESAWEQTEPTHVSHRGSKNERKGAWKQQKAVPRSPQEQEQNLHKGPKAIEMEEVSKDKEEVSRDKEEL